MARKKREPHFINRIGWLRAAVLGANDGVVSVGSLIVGVAAASTDRSAVILAGVAGWIAGAMSMAAGEYVSVSSQADTEKADLERERQELRDDPEGELRELAGIYVKRGLTKALAMQVAEQLHAKDALDSHARDELGISEAAKARPVQAALASALSFTAGAALPLIVTFISPTPWLIGAVVAASLAALAVMGALGARTGGANVPHAIVRVVFWGALAMGVTAGVGRLLGANAG